MTKTNNTIQTLIYLTGWFLLCIAGLTVPQSTHAFAKDPVFEARKKQGVSQLKQLIRQNRQNNLRNQRHKNWYIFGDYVRLMGNNTLVNTQFGVLTKDQIDDINDNLIKFNRDNHGVIFYVYLTGFKVPLDSKVSTYEIKDYGKFNGDYKAMFQALDQQRKKIALQEIQTYEAKLLKAIFSEGSKETQAPKKTAIYGQTIFIAPERDQNNQVKYKIQNFVGFAFGDEVRDAYANDFKNLHGRWRHQPKKVAESSVAYYLRVHTKAAMEAFNGKKMPEGDDHLEKYSAAWFAKNTAANRNAQWAKDVNAVSDMLKARIKQNDQLDFEQRTGREHNFARRYIIGRYRNDQTEGGPVLSQEIYTLLNDKMMLLEKTCRKKFYVVYYEVNYYIPKNDPDFGNTQKKFTQDIITKAGNAIDNQTLVLCIPFFRANTVKANGKKSPYALKSFAFPQYHQGTRVKAQLAQAFEDFKQGNVYNLALALYKAIPKPHYVYSQYFKLGGNVLYSQINNANHVAGFKDIYEYHLFVDQRMQALKDLEGYGRARKELEDDIYAARPKFKHIKHGMREYALEKWHRAFGYHYAHDRYSLYLDYLRSIRQQPPRVPAETALKKPKEKDLVVSILDFSSALLSFVGLDIVPEAIGFVYSEVKGDDAGKVKYLAGILMVGPSGLMKNLSWMRVKAFVRNTVAVSKKWLKFSAKPEHSVLLLDHQLKFLKEVRWKTNDEVLDVIIHADGKKYVAYLENATGKLQTIDLDVKDLAEIIRNTPSNQPIRLLSCSNLESAKQLSNQLKNREVYATEDIVLIHIDGGITTLGRFENKDFKWRKLKGGQDIGEAPIPYKPAHSIANKPGKYVMMMPYKNKPDKVTSVVTAGGISHTKTSSKALGHAEIQGMQALGNKMKDKDVVISDVIGTFPGNKQDMVPVCAECRANIFDLAEKYGATSITFPKVVGNKFEKNITVTQKHFKEIKDEVQKVIEKYNQMSKSAPKGGINYGGRSEEAWKIIEEIIKK